MNGQEGWEKASEFYPDLIITDLVMPVIDGFEMIKNIRRSRELQEVVVIASSASVFETDQYKSLSVGANEFLPKPVQAEILLEMLRVHLRLEWIYEEKKVEAFTDQASTSPQFSAFNTQSIVSPPAHVLVQLYDLSKKGELDEILEKVAQLVQSDARFAPFSREIFELAENFQLTKIRKFIKQYIDSN